MGNVHILRTPGKYDKWKPSIERWPDAAGTRGVLTDCCNRLEILEHTESRIFSPTLYDKTGEPTAGAYMGGWQDHRCKKGHGCTVNLGMKRTAHLRAGWYTTRD